MKKVTWLLSLVAIAVVFLSAVAFADSVPPSA
jgi:hypothetical protein